MTSRSRFDAVRPNAWFSLLPLGVLLLASSVSFAANDRVDYLTQIKPVLRERCFACHGALNQEGSLRLDTAALAIKGGDSGAAIEPGDAGASLLLERVSASDEGERMPPEGEPLEAEQIAALRNWIAQEAEAPPDEQPERDPRDHWAFTTPVRPAVPQADQPTPEQSRWQHNPIDAFIAREHRKHGLVPQAPANKRVWLRRVSLDLIGLPPTPEELDAFVADPSSEAYDKVVTRLLASPQYGQRWGRHWMDIWRYSDWWGLGAEVRNSHKHIWHWRDWIVESLNDDKGYDQMLREMLAADELYPNDLDRLRATGFLVRQYFIFNRTTWLDNTIEHSAKSMLGLTFNCAKCHDHKYDPLSQVEYYRFRALFEPYQLRHEMVPGQTDFEKDGIPRAFDAHLEVPTYLHLRGDDRTPDKSRSLEPGVPAFLSSDARALAIEPVSLPIEATYPGLRPSVVKTHREAAEQQIAAARAALDAAQKKFAESEAAARQTSSGGSPASPSKDPATTAPALSSEKNTAESPVLVRDDFSVAKPDVWEQLTGQWSYADGKLRQSQTGPTRATLRLKQLPPADFEARLKYIPTGGEMWKSVGISFDVTAEGNDLLAYVSAYAGGPKSQIAFKQGGNYVYPPQAVQARKVALQQPHEIVLQVRDTLLNMRVDGEHSLAFRLPDDLKRQRGFLELIAFDATVEFVAFELRALPNGVKLVDAAAAPGSSGSAASPALQVDQARLAVTIADQAVKAAEAQLASIDARAAADRVRYMTPAADSDSATKTLLLAASKSERVAAAARAEEAVSRAELALLQAAADKKADAEKKLAAAKTALKTSRQAIDTPSEAYTPLPGAKKTQEDYQNRNAKAPYPTLSTGRRTAFAKWLTDPRHPLPARVAINHIWTRHMGQPLVPTIFDFGRKGTPPTHPELLDWLAVELVEHDWSMKHIHRLIVTSQAYRLSSSSREEGEKGRGGQGETDGQREDTVALSPNFLHDPDNHFYWRMNPVRMEAQIVRDSLLSLAGELDVSLGGPSIAVNDAASRRRSLYFVHSHNDQQKFLSMFDDANVLDCYRRAESIVPQQALALENSPLVTAMAEKITQRVKARTEGERETGRQGEGETRSVADREFVRAAFVMILSVEPTAEEQATLMELLVRMTELARAKKNANPEAAARTSVVHTILNHNDFITVR